MNHRLYSDLAAWWPLFAPAGYYEEQAGYIVARLEEVCPAKPWRVLELGSGGGSMAFHLRQHADLTLVEPQDAMLEVCRRLNPGADHVKGDMRSVRLDRLFDAVIIHDAINYMTQVNDVIAALTTARTHLRPGGLAMIFPDDTEETFAPSIHTGGQDDPAAGRGLRYLSWSHPVIGSSYTVDFALVLRSADGSVEVVHDRHTFGVFSRATWRDAFRQAGFPAPDIRPDKWRADVFLAGVGSHCGGTATIRKRCGSSPAASDPACNVTQEDAAKFTGVQREAK
jgi:SAM-dependent methyltransferase